MHFNAYDVFYSLYSQQHVSASIAVGSEYRGRILFTDRYGDASLWCRFPSFRRTIMSSSSSGNS